MTVCRSFDDKNDLDNQGDNNEKLNEWNDVTVNQEVIASKLVRF